MATLITNGKQTIKLYQSSNRGKPLYQLAYYTGGRRVQRNFADKAEAKRTANQVLGGMTEDSALVDNLGTPELESLVAAKKVLISGYALHVAVEEHAQAVTRLGKTTLREAVDFFLSHHRADVPRLMLAETAEQFAASRQQSGLSAHYISQCRKTVSDLSKAFPSKALTDLRTSELDAWLGALPLWAYVATVPASLCKSDEDPPFRPTLLGTAFWLGDAFLPTGQRPGKFLAATHAKPCKTGYTTATDNSLSIFRETP